jgi:hypothetical protein
VAGKSPAAGRLRVGDVLLDVENDPPSEGRYSGEPVPLYNKLSAFDAGQTAQLVIKRDGTRITVPVQLGSLKDAVTMFIPEDEDRVDAL